MRWKKLAIAVASLTAAAAPAQAAPRAVVELFTSPFCSACPPADELFVELAQRSDLITLVMPTESYDRPGRKDALAKPAFTDRQIAYAEARNTDMLYTPQAVVNGTADAEGSDPEDIGGAIARTRGALSVPVKASVQGETIVVTAGAAKAGGEQQATLTLLPFVARRDVPMRGGETHTYANLVRDIVPLGAWTGKPVRHALSRQSLAGYDGLVVLLQAGPPDHPGAIIGAARIALKGSS